MISREISTPISRLTTGVISHPSQSLASYEENERTNEEQISWGYQQLRSSLELTRACAMETRVVRGVVAAPSALAERSAR